MDYFILQKRKRDGETPRGREREIWVWVSVLEMWPLKSLKSAVCCGDPSDGRCVMGREAVGGHRGVR